MVEVIDGDTIHILHSGKADRISLTGIDCPEKGQAYGQNAKYVASDLVFGKEVNIQMQGKDKYRHSIGDVFLPNGTNVSQKLVKEGWCWCIESIHQRAMSCPCG